MLSQGTKRYWQELGESFVDVSASSDEVSIDARDGSLVKDESKMITKIATMCKSIAAQMLNFASSLCIIRLWIKGLYR